MSTNPPGNDAAAQSSGSHDVSSPLDGFQTYGWEPDATKSADENFMDLTMLITRGSKLTQGSMACLFVQEDEKKEGSNKFVDRILCVANNMPLFKKNASDIHAEIFAMGKAARRGIVLNECTAYITMPPCKNCFVALYSAGFKRIVSNKKADELLRGAAAQHGIAMEVVPSDRKRVDEIVKAYNMCKECEPDAQASKKQKTS